MWISVHVYIYIYIYIYIYRIYIHLLYVYDERYMIYTTKDTSQFEFDTNIYIIYIYIQKTDSRERVGDTDTP